MQFLIIVSKQILFYIKYFFTSLHIMLWSILFICIFLVIQESATGVDILNYLSKKLLPYRRYLTLDRITQYYLYLSLVVYLMGTFLRKKLNIGFKYRHKLLIALILIFIGYSFIVIGIYMRSAFTYAYLYYIFIFLFLFHVIYTFILLGIDKLISKGIDFLDKVSNLPVKLSK